MALFLCVYQTYIKLHYLTFSYFSLVLLRAIQLKAATHKAAQCTDLIRNIYLQPNNRTTMKKLTLLASILCALSLSTFACDDDDKDKSKSKNDATVEDDAMKNDNSSTEGNDNSSTEGNDTPSNGGNDNPSNGENNNKPIYEDEGKACTAGSDFCYDEKTVMICVAGEYTHGNCDYKCSDQLNRCIAEAEDGNDNPSTGGNDKPEKGECNLTDAPTCSDDSTVMTCSDMYFTDGKDYIPTKVYTRCSIGSSCKGGKCVLDDNAACVVDSCKDLHTLSTCVSGNIVERACSDDELCIADKCTQLAGVKTCTKSSECDADQNCRDGLCYDNSNMNIKVGDPCNSLTFQEYCDGDKEIKCGYDKVVEINDCAPYNGCAMRVQKAYSKNIAIRNAACRGESAQLELCTHAGVLGNMCINEDDPDWPYYYSVTNACEYGTDGSLMFVEARDETECSKKCVEATGLCPE